MDSWALPQDPCCLIGMKISMPASHFGNAWAKQTFNKEWRQAVCVGWVRSVKVQKGKGRQEQQWNVQYDLDGKVHPITWDDLVNTCDIDELRKRLQLDSRDEESPKPDSLVGDGATGDKRGSASPSSGGDAHDADELGTEDGEDGDRSLLQVLSFGA